jgi:ATP-dependent Clp protease ATP-binding subunit ClpA
MAVVFVSNGKDPKPQGLCTVCAKELGLTQVNDMMKQMGITDEMLEEANDQLTELMNGGDPSSLFGMMGFQNPEASGEEDEEEADGGDDFEMGGTPTFPKTLQELFGGMQGQNNDHKADGGKKPPKPPKKEQPPKRKYLDAYCENLTRKARAGKLDKIIGRDQEIARVIQILSRRTKNNPCLIGEPGVGKTAIAEGLALRIAAGDVPLNLRGKEIELLDLTALVAGTQFRGQFESRIKGLIAEVRSLGNVILFIDEVHTLVGTGDAEGSMNAANILKPALSRGQIQVIGATTFTEYRKYIEKDAALERRFQTVSVNEPSIDETVTVLKGIRGYYETFHRVHISDALLRKAAIYSERYITDRFLPDKAIDLLDEACTCAALRSKALHDLDVVTAQLQEKRAEEERIMTENDTYDYEEIANLRAEIAKLSQQEARVRPQAENVQVTDEDLAQILTMWTGIPSERIRAGEMQRLAGLADDLKKKIIGQDEAVQQLAAAVRRSRLRLSPRRRPASFIFVGPTGVGKTELVKVLSKELFDTPETLIRLDMSEYMEKHSVSKIIGSPPGYVGYDEAGQVTEKVRRQPYSVLLFDEIEKAHPDVLNILLQILDEGRITDAQGRTVNFENTVIVMTSNAGSDRTENIMGFGQTVEDAAREKAMKALREFLRPEFLSRVDEVIVFRTLTQEDYARIAALTLDEYVDALKEQSITFMYDTAATEAIAAATHGGRSGARDIRIHIRRKVEDPLAEMIVQQGEGTVTGVKLTTDEQGELLLLTL